MEGIVLVDIVDQVWMAFYVNKHNTIHTWSTMSTNPIPSIPDQFCQQIQYHPYRIIGVNKPNTIHTWSIMSTKLTPSIADQLCQQTQYHPYLIKLCQQTQYHPYLIKLCQQTQYHPFLINYANKPNTIHTWSIMSTSTMPSIPDQLCQPSTIPSIPDQFCQQITIPSIPDRLCQQTQCHPYLINYVKKPNTIHTWSIMSTNPITSIPD